MSHVLRHSPMWTACRSSISHPVEPSFSVSYCILVNKHCTTEVLGFPSFGSDCVVYVVRCVQDLNPHLQETLVEGRPTAIQKSGTTGEPNSKENGNQDKSVSLPATNHPQATALPYQLNHTTKNTQDNFTRGDRLGMLLMLRLCWGPARIGGS